MIALQPRVAYFPDSFHEINGVAHTSRHFEDFARRRDLPFLCVRAGNRRQPLEKVGNVWTLELPRGVFSLPLEKDLRFDPAYLRHLPVIEDVLEQFDPDVVHVTGPSEIGMLAVAIARHRNLPLAASWHTNVHEYAARRSVPLLRLLPRPHSLAAARTIEDLAFAVATEFYSKADLLFAPNLQTGGMLERATHRPCYQMSRGVDSVLFDPHKRTRAENDPETVLGFVGRLSVEKNVHLLAAVQRELDLNGCHKVRFLIVGHGSEESWLRENLPRAEFRGVLKGEALAKAYANMDLFIFPSHTDTFGNVVLEALSSGVPAVVTPDGGPCTIVQDGVSGRVVPDADFARAITDILEDRGRHAEMRRAARLYALTANWDSVFEGVYAAYEKALSRQCRAVR
jgi:glycosyltransferase involved in cell wall biosynthesis